MNIQALAIINACLDPVRREATARAFVNAARHGQAQFASADRSAVQNLVHIGLLELKNERTSLYRFSGDSATRDRVTHMYLGRDGSLGPSLRHS